MGSNTFHSNQDRWTNNLFALRQQGIILSQQQVGILLDMDHTAVSHHENGTREPNLANLRAYARLYNVPLSDITAIDLMRDEWTQQMAIIKTVTTILAKYNIPWKKRIADVILVLKASLEESVNSDLGL
jgi:transcriptional regulator with XRE-family HTH domain